MLAINGHNCLGQITFGVLPLKSMQALYPMVLTKSQVQKKDVGSRSWPDMDFGIQSGSAQLNGCLQTRCRPPCLTLEGLCPRLCFQSPSSCTQMAIFLPKQRGTFILCETSFGGCAHGQHMLTGLDPVLNRVTAIFFFLKSLPQEGAIFLFKPQFVRSLAQIWVMVQISLEIHHVPGEQEMTDVGPEELFLHALTLPTKVKPDP